MKLSEEKRVVQGPMFATSFTGEVMYFFQDKRKGERTDGSKGKNSIPHEDGYECTGKEE